MKKKTFYKIIIILLICVAWGHSMMPPSASSAESGFVTDVLRRIVPNISGHFVRKAAHFTEYLLLGVFMTLYSCENRKKTDLKIFANRIFSGLFVSFIDETIQIFSGRGPMISDMWIDLFGFTVGAIVFSIICRDYNNR